MIFYNLPRRIRYIPASAIYTAQFNAPTTGKYDFAGQSQVFIEKLLPHTVYLIDSLSIGGNISSEDFLNAVNIIPVFTLQKALDKEAIFDQPIQVHSYSTDRQIVHFFKTGLSNTSLIASLTGVINQTAALVGTAFISLSVNLSIHAIDESDFEKTFKEQG